LTIFIVYGQMKFKQNITKGLNRSSLCIGCKKLMTVFGFEGTGEPLSVLG
jgi:hypothetical protein